MVDDDETHRAGKSILNVLQDRKDGMAWLTAGAWKLRGIQTGTDKESRKPPFK
jgi:hypothetical protein